MNIFLIEIIFLNSKLIVHNSPMKKSKENSKAMNRFNASDSKAQPAAGNFTKIIPKNRDPTKEEKNQLISAYDSCLHEMRTRKMRSIVSI